MHIDERNTNKWLQSTFNEKCFSSCAGLFLQPALPHAAGSRSCLFVGMFTSWRLKAESVGRSALVGGNCARWRLDRKHRRRPVGASGKDHRASGERGRNGQVDISGGVIAVPMAARWMTSNIAGEGGRPLPAAELEHFFSPDGQWSPIGLENGSSHNPVGQFSPVCCCVLERCSS